MKPPTKIAERTIRLSLPQFRILNYLRGTGDYVGREAMPRQRNCFKFALRSLLSLTRRGLISHLIAGDYYLQDAGREWHRVGRPLHFTLRQYRDEHFNKHTEITAV